MSLVTPLITAHDLRLVRLLASVDRAWLRLQAVEHGCDTSKRCAACKRDATFRRAVEKWMRARHEKTGGEKTLLG